MKNPQTTVEHDKPQTTEEHGKPQTTVEHDKPQPTVEHDIDTIIDIKGHKHSKQNKTKYEF